MLSIAHADEQNSNGFDGRHVFFRLMIYREM
jgi:hypothetical protein